MAQSGRIERKHIRFGASSSKEVLVNTFSHSVERKTNEPRPM